MGIPGCNRIVAFAGVIAPSAVTLPSSWPGGIWLSRSGIIGALPMLLLVTSISRISSVCSSIPVCILLHSRRLGPPYLRAFHSPSPSALIPVLSISSCNGPVEPLYGMATDSVFCRQHKVLKSGPTSSSRLATKPVVCLNGRPNKTLSVWLVSPHRYRLGGVLLERK